jgi:streptomycin 6-kinase
MAPTELRRMERLAREIASEWGLSLAAPFERSNYSYVAPAGEHAVLKIGADDGESLHEADALKLWAGSGAVRLLGADRSRCALLLERARPGTDLAILSDPAATETALEVASKLWVRAGSPFRAVAEQLPAWIAQAQPESVAGQRLLAEAHELHAGLVHRPLVLIHGDLHHHNILDAGGRYVAIDPKPMLGEPEFDVAPFLWNPLGSEMTLERSEQRLAVFAAAGLDQRRMRSWALIRGAYLTVGDWVGEHAIEVLRALQSE